VECTNLNFHSRGEERECFLISYINSALVFGCDKSVKPAWCFYPAIFPKEEEEGEKPTEKVFVTTPAHAKVLIIHGL
jgi:hypothetical protein